MDVCPTLAVMKLSTQYYKLTNDPSPFGHDWLKAMDTIVNVITEMQEVNAAAQSLLPSWFR